MGEGKHYFLVGLAKNGRMEWLCAGMIVENDGLIEIYCKNTAMLPIVRWNFMVYNWEQYEKGRLLRDEIL